MISPEWEETLESQHKTKRWYIWRCRCGLCDWVASIFAWG